MGFQLDRLSIKRLVGVHPDLGKVVTDCARTGTMPFIFGITEGLRTVAQQKKNVAAGVSETMASRHLDGHAVDLVVLLPEAGSGSQVTWAWPPYYVLAHEMRAASIRTLIPLIWGGVWDVELAKLGEDVHAESMAYVARALAKKERGFTDGPHFELPLSKYPAGQPVA